MGEIECHYYNAFCNNTGFLNFMQTHNLTDQGVRFNTEFWTNVDSYHQVHPFEDWVYELLRDIRKWDEEYVKFHNTEFAFFRIVSPMICFIGVMLNLISIIVLHRDLKMRSTTRMLLQSLAVADLLFLLLTGTFHLLSVRYFYMEWITGEHWNYPYVRAYLQPIWHIFRTCTIWTIVLATADRYVSVFKPVRTSKFSTVQRVRIAVGAIWLASLVYNLPRFFEKRIIILTNPRTNETDPYWAYTAMGFSRVYIGIYGMVLHIILLYAVPLTALVVMTIRLSTTFRQTYSHLLDSSYEGGLHKSYTFMLVLVVTLFVVCQTPMLIIFIWDTIEGPYPTSITTWVTHFAHKYMAVIGEMFLIINSSVNFLVYCAVSKHFRVTVCHLICRRKMYSDSHIMELDDVTETPPK